MKIQTEYQLNRKKQVIAVEFTSDGQSVRAELATVNGEEQADLKAGDHEYRFTSYLHGDKDRVKAPELLSLADCILQAHILLGLIPPQTLPQIPCDNKH